MLHIYCIIIHSIRHGMKKRWEISRVKITIIHIHVYTNTTNLYQAGTIFLCLSFYLKQFVFLFKKNPTNSVVDFSPVLYHFLFQPSAYVMHMIHVNANKFTEKTGKRKKNNTIRTVFTTLTLFLKTKQQNCYLCVCVCFVVVRLAHPWHSLALTI